MGRIGRTDHMGKNHSTRSDGVPGEDKIQQLETELRMAKGRKKPQKTK